MINHALIYCREFLKDRSGRDYAQECFSLIEALDESDYKPDQINHARKVLSLLSRMANL